MTKQRHCFVAQVGDAIEALASALDPEREPPFKGDILDLLEWAARDVLEIRQQLAETQHARDVFFDSWEREKQQLDAANTLINKYREETTSLHQQVKLLSDFVTKISEQLPEKPDHWSSCSQCEYNSSDAQDIIEALAATAPKEELK